VTEFKGQPRQWLRRIELATRAASPAAKDARERRWAGLPPSAQTPEQSVGRFAVGCEGTHGVFPKCNLTCSPCYHSADANKVRIDGQHTVSNVEAQMALLEQERGPNAHAQLIGGEVSLLDPDAHAESLLAMRSHGREPMSMTHGDFDYEYLERLALDDSGRPRFDKLSFAGHFDSLMRGRRGIPRPRQESELEMYRKAFVEMFRRLKREHGVNFFLAHNMTVTPQNVGQIAETVAVTKNMGYGLLSFQPAAFVGDDRRWSEDMREATPDEIWTEVEKGAGHRLAHTAVQMGDPRCNRTSFGLMVGDQYVALIDDERPIDIKARDVFFKHCSGMVFSGQPPWLSAARLMRLAVRHPSAMAITARWAAGKVGQAGGIRAVVHGGIRPMTYVMHMFMDAEQVTPAWDLMENGVTANDPEVLATQQRLGACIYAMAHPETGRIVPACVQHSVLDPGENKELRNLLPLVDVRNSARSVA
jgi:hypothetical protein